MRGGILNGGTAGKKEHAEIQEGTMVSLPAFDETKATKDHGERQN
jgi:hypothetical protein